MPSSLLTILTLAKAIPGFLSNRRLKLQVVLVPNFPKYIQDVELGASVGVK